jgi:sec-independent protein translocase protein TatA
MLSSLSFISMPGGTEWILIVLAVLILFGGRKIPEFMRGLGKGMREFKDAKDNVRREIEEGMNEKDGTPVNTNNTSSTSTSKANSL